MKHVLRQPCGRSQFTRFVFTKKFSVDIESGWPAGIGNYDKFAGNAQRLCDYLFPLRGGYMLDDIGDHHRIKSMVPEWQLASGTTNRSHIPDRPRCKSDVTPDKGA